MELRAPAPVPGRRRARARAYRVTSAVGVAAAALAACACAARSFATLCLSSVALGLPAAAGQTFRFAVLTLVPAESRPRCVGLVLTGGVVGAVLGPGYAAGSRDLFPEAEFAGVYLCAALAYATLLAVVLAPNLVAFPAEQGDDEASKTTVYKGHTDDDAAERVPPRSGLADRLRFRALASSRRCSSPRLRTRRCRF